MPNCFRETADFKDAVCIPGGARGRGRGGRNGMGHAVCVVSSAEHPQDLTVSLTVPSITADLLREQVQLVTVPASPQDNPKDSSTCVRSCFQNRLSTFSDSRFDMCDQKAMRYTNHLLEIVFWTEADKSRSQKMTTFVSMLRYIFFIECPRES